MGWRITQDRNFVLSFFMPAKFIRDKNILNMVNKSHTRDSRIWKGLFVGIENMYKYSCWYIGDGYDINIWHDKWIGDPNIHLTQPNNFLENCILVKHLITNYGIWDDIKLQEYFNQRKVQAIKETKIHFGYMDLISLNLTVNGNFSVKSLYTTKMGGKIIRMQTLLTE